MIPLEKVKKIIDKHAKLEIDLSATNIDKKKFAEMSKEYSDLNEVINDAKFFTFFNIEKENLEKIINIYLLNLYVQKHHYLKDI